LKFGPVIQSHEIDDEKGRISEDPLLGFSEPEKERRKYFGGQIEFQLQYVDHQLFPTNGIRLRTQFSYLKDSNKSESVSEFNTSLQFYFQLATNPKLVLANSIGYRKAAGDLLFHQYSDLGNDTNLRGFRNNRFRGEQALYHNVDLRMQLFKWRNNIIPMDIGIVGGYDTGRVWLEGETSDRWHNSASIGIWMDILGIAIVQPYYSFVDEENSVNLRLGFSF